MGSAKRFVAGHILAMALCRVIHNPLGKHHPTPDDGVLDAALALQLVKQFVALPGLGKHPGDGKLVFLFHVHNAEVRIRADGNAGFLRVEAKKLAGVFAHQAAELFQRQLSLVDLRQHDRQEALDGRHAGIGPPYAFAFADFLFFLDEGRMIGADVGDCSVPDVVP